MIPLSVLDLAPITEGGDAAQSFRNCLDLAQHVERWDYQRFWLAEPHGMPGIASAATAVLIGHVAGGTSRIRVGAGGIMLPLKLGSAEPAAGVPGIPGVAGVPGAAFAGLTPIAVNSASILETRTGAASSWLRLA